MLSICFVKLVGTITDSFVKFVLLKGQAKYVLRYVIVLSICFVKLASTVTDSFVKFVLLKGQA